ncbi:MAG: hypothetical protein R3C19_09335 [Planctomycetaceae bacterium]
MYRNQRMQQLLKAVVILSVCLAGSVRAAQDSALEKLAELVGEIVGEVTGDDHDHIHDAILMEFAPPEEAAFEPTEAEVAARRERLKTYADAFQDWAARTLELTESEQSGLHTALQDQLQQLGKNWKPNSGQPVSDYTPIIFTTQDGAAEFLNSRGVPTFLTGVLTSEKRRNVFRDRRLAIDVMDLKYAITLFDHELFLTPDQRDDLSAAIEDGIAAFDGQFAFNATPYYLPMASLNDIVTRLPKTLLSEVQRQRLADVVQTNGNEQYLMISTSAGFEAWNKQLDDAVAGQQDRFARAIAVRVSWLEQILKLTPDQARHLEIAGKGAASQCIAEWKKQTRVQLKEWEKQFVQQFAGQDFSFAMNLPDVDKLDENKLWLHAVEKLDSSGVRSERTEFRRDALVGHVTGMLDRELWLSADQRADLKVLVDKSLPATVKVTQPYFGDMELLVVPLFRISDDDLAAVLTEPQKAAWKNLQTQFQVAGNTVMLTIQGGGQIGFNLPQ